MSHTYPSCSSCKKTYNHDVEDGDYVLVAVAVMQEGQVIEVEYYDCMDLCVTLPSNIPKHVCRFHSAPCLHAINAAQSYCTHCVTAELTRKIIRNEADIRKLVGSEDSQHIHATPLQHCPECMRK